MIFLNEDDDGKCLVGFNGDWYYIWVRETLKFVLKTHDHKVMRNYL